MKILWLSNVILTDEDHGSSGTWLGALAQRLAASGEVLLGNITSGSVSTMTRRDCGQIPQWIAPSSALSKRDGLPPKSTIAAILKAVDEFEPDLVHVWGTESYWGLLTARNRITRPALLETQGLKFAIAPVFSGGLSFREQLACIGLKELYRRSAIFQARRSFAAWGAFEKEIISKHRHITVQSDWLEAQILGVNGAVRIYRNDFVLRKLFYSAQPWTYSGRPVLFCSAAYPAPFKGLHVAIRAAALLNRRRPGLELRIAGTHNRTGLRRDGYIAWVEREARRLGFDGKVTWLGPLSAERIVQELLQSSAMVIPSYIEGYCLGLAEAMQLGVPSVVSFAGGSANMAQDGDSALFFPPGDDAMCAWQLERVLTDQVLSSRLAGNARAAALARNDPEKILARQLDIYRQIIGS